MANPNNPIPDDLFSDFERLQEHLESLSRAYGNQRVTMTDAERATKAANQANKDLVAGVAKLGNSITRFTTATSSQEGAYKAMGDATAMVTKGIGKLAGKLPIIGGFLEGLGEAAGEAIKVMTEATGKAFATFGKLSQTGIVGSFQDMRDAAEKTGLMFDEIDGVLSSHSQSLAALGGNAAAGAKSFERILETNKSLAAQAVKLGYSFSEFSEFEASYIEMQTRAGLTKGKNDKELAESAAAYAYELDTLSKLTGKSRAEIQKEQQALQDNARVRAAMLDMPKEMQDKLRATIGMLPKGAQEGVAELVANFGAPLSEAGRQLTKEAAAAGVDINGLTKQFREGKISSVEFVSQLRGGAGKIVHATKDITKVVGTDFVKNYTMWADMAQQTTDVQGEYNKIIEDRKRQLEEGDPAADAQNMAREVALKSQNILTSSQTIMAANAAVGKGMLALADTIDTVIKRFGGSPVNTGTSKIIEGTKNLIPADSFSSKSVPVPTTRGLSSSNFDFQKFMKTAAILESGGNANARAATSSASGLYQFTDATWKSTVAKMGKNYSLDDRFDPQKSAEVMSYFTQQNQQQLERRLGRRANSTEMYMAHFLGAGGAGKFLTELENNPNASASALFGAAARANSNIFFDGARSRSLSEVYNVMQNKVSKAEGMDSSRMASLSTTMSPPPAPVQSRPTVTSSSSPSSSMETLLASANNKLDDVIFALNRIHRTNKDMAHAMS